MKRRDKELGDALKALDVPDHHPGFFAELSEKLGFDLTEESSDTAVRDEGAADRPTLKRAEGPVSQGRMYPRTPGERRTRGLFTRHKLRWAIAAVVVALVILVAVMFAPGGRYNGSFVERVAGPQPASAAEIKAKVVKALETARALRGVLIVVSYESPGATPSAMRWEFITTAQGDFLLIGTNTLADGSRRTDKLAFDHATGTERSYSLEGDTGPIVGERTGLANGLPDPSPSDWVLERRLGSVVRALLAANDVSVTESTYQSRPTWTLDAPVQSNRLSDVSSDHIKITVDQQTGFPVNVIETLKGAPVEELRVLELRIDPEIPSGTFTIRPPADVQVLSTDSGFVRVDLDRASNRVGYPVVTPAWVPPGFALQSVAVAKRSGPTGKEGMNPESSGVVSLLYRRGFDRLIVTTRLVGKDPAAWSDPLASGEGFMDKPVSLTLSAGAFKGEAAELLIDPRSTPHIWAKNSTLVLTVSGDLSAEDLRHVAESMGDVQAGS